MLSERRKALMEDVLLDTDQASRLLGLASGTLRKWRLAGRGPAFVRLGRSVKYRKSELEGFVSRRTFTSTALADASDNGVDFV